MGKLVVTTFVSLDGVMDEPQNWSLEYWNDEIADFKDEENRESSALLLGRVTYQGFAEAWPSRSGEYADHFNAMPKYVVSDTLEEAAWNNSQILRGDDLVGKVRALKDETEGHIAVHGSRHLAQWLLRNGLVDELRLLLYPIVLGSGERLLDGLAETKLSLIKSCAFSGGATLLVYRPEGS